jgi:hypothetical protein
LNFSGIRDPTNGIHSSHGERFTGASLLRQESRVLDTDVAQITELSAPRLICGLAGDKRRLATDD